MGHLDKYLTLKNSLKLKLNNAVMEGVAKAISSKAEEEFKQYLDSGIPSFENNLPYKEKQTQKMDFDSVMSLMKEIKSYENNNEYQLTLGVIDKFYNSHLNDEYIEKEKIKLCCTSETELFKSLLFWGLYFIVKSCFAKSAKNDNEVIYGDIALEIFIKSQYPDFAQWLNTANSKYKKSDIFTNTKSESLLRFFYDGLTYSQEIRPVEIIPSLMSFRNDLIEEFEQLFKTQLTDKCFKHPITEESAYQQLLEDIGLLRTDTTDTSVKDFEMNIEKIEYYVCDIGYLVHELIESKEKRKEIFTHIRELSNSGNTEMAASHLADELALPVVHVFFINSHDKKQMSVFCDYETDIDSVHIPNFDYSGEGIVMFTRPDEGNYIETEMFCDVLSEYCAIFYASDDIETFVTKDDTINITDNKTAVQFGIG